MLQDVLFVWSKIKITFVFMFLRPKYQHLAYVGSDQGGPKFSSSHPVFVVEAPHLVVKSSTVAKTGPSSV